MNRHLFLFILLIGLQIFAMGQGTPAFNPTGTYKLDNKTYMKDGDKYGYFGTIRVKLLKRDTIALSLYVCQGAPSYNSGSFVDTLVYRNHRAVYHHCESDTSCRITFSFTNKGLDVDQVQADINFGCGFGHAVLADFHYKKVSAKVPVIEMEDE